MPQLSYTELARKYVTTPTGDRPLVVVGAMNSDGPLFGLA